jgi:hypothetical protein
MAEVYPSDATLNALVNDSLTGVLYVTTGEAPYYLSYRKMLYRLLLASQKANEMRLFDEGSLNVGVKAGKFWDGTTLRTYAGSTGNTLADDKANIYVYINSAGTLVITEYSAYPDTHVNHIRLATVTTSGGDITAITDDRGHHAFYTPGSVLDEGEFYSDAAGATTTPMAMYWESASPADADAMSILCYADNSAAEKTEYAKLTVTLDDVTDATEDASLSFSVMVGGALTSQGDFVGTLSANATGKSCAVQANATGGVTVLFRATLTAGSTVAVHSSAAPFAYRVLDAWSVALGTDEGTWKITDGTNDITDAVAVSATDKTINRAGTIDNTYHEIAASGSLSVVGDGSLADVEVYILAVRV